MIFDPITWQLSHYVIKEKDKEPRLVPVLMVADETEGVLHLRCTKAEAAALEPFVETHYIKSQMPVDTPYAGGYGLFGYGMYYGSYSVPLEERDVPVQEERIPAGELMVQRGMRVEATDGYVGKVDQFLLDFSTETITHLVLEEKHHLHKQQITIPVSAIDQIVEDTVYLKLDRHGVALLPAIPIKRHLWPHPASKHTELLGIVFEDTEGASRGLEFVRQLHQRKLLKIIEAAVLVKASDGTTSVRETMSAAVKHGKVFGAVAGGFVGLLVGPVGLIVGALAGAGAGGAVADRSERDFSHEFLENLEQLLQPGRSALVMLVEHEDVHALSEELGNLDQVVSRVQLSDMVVAQLTGDKGQSPQPTANPEVQSPQPAVNPEVQEA
jgi:uncharacterized membrane protein